MSKKIRIAITTLLSFAIISLVSLTITPLSANAIKNFGAQITKKAVANSISNQNNIATADSNCSDPTSWFIPQVDLKYYSFDSFVRKDRVNTFRTAKNVLLPNSWGNSARDGAITCNNVYTGTGGVPQQLKQIPLERNDSNADKVAFVTALGYGSTGDGTIEKCITLKYNYYKGSSSATTSATTNKYCLDVYTDDNRIKDNSAKIDGDPSSPLALLNDRYSPGLGNVQDRLRINVTDGDYYTDERGGFGDFPKESVAAVNITQNMSWNDFISNLKQAVHDGFSSYLKNNAKIFDDDKYEIIEDAPLPASEYVIGQGPINIFKYLTGAENRNNYNYTSSERLALLYYYVFSYLGLRVNTNTSGNCDTSGSYTVPIAKDDSRKASEVTWCSVDTSQLDKVESDGKTVNVIVNNTQMATKSPKELFDYFKAITLTDLLLQDVEAPTIEQLIDPDYNPGDEAQDSGNTEEGGTDNDTGLKEWTLADCYKVAGVAGWVVCPVLSFMREVIPRFYDGMIVPYMQINPSLMNYSESNGTYRAWASFRDIANIIFVILLLFVIFSQVTGFGIDNYGIKRTLPKLIIGAILVNISFFLCQLAADLSNLAGSAIQNMLTSFASFSGSNAEFLGGTGDDLMGGIVGTLLSISAFGGLVWAGFQSGVISGGWVFIMPILLAFASGIISLIFLLVLLGARQAAIVALTVFSPLALVFYALPNTNGIAKRWLKMFEGLLLLYPICGAMVGAGRLTSGVILSLSSTGFWTNLMAFLLTVIPFFFIPTLLRNSMSAIGNIGARISSIGGRLNGRATGALGNTIRSSSSYQTQANRASQFRSTRLREREKRNAENTMRRLDRIRAQNGSLTERQQRQYQQAQMSARRAQRAQHEEELAASDYARMNEKVGLNGETRQQLADQEAAEAQMIKDENAAVSRGYKYTDANGDEQVVNTDNLKSLKDAFAYETSRSDQNSQTLARAMALKSAMEQFHGKKGMDAVGEVMDAGQMTVPALTRVASSIGSDGNYKSQARSLHKAANKIRENTANYKTGMVSEIRNTGGTLEKSMKAKDIVDMTDNEFDGFIRAATNGSPEVKAQASALASAALSEGRIRTQLSNEQINALSNVVHASSTSNNSGSMQPGQSIPIFNSNGQTQFISNSAANSIIQNINQQSGSGSNANPGAGSPILNINTPNQSNNGNSNTQTPPNGPTGQNQPPNPSS